MFKTNRRIKKGGPVILGGDFNSKPGSSVHKMFTLVQCKVLI